MQQSDGCTLFPDGWWHECCHAHDVGYWLGEVARAQLDLELATCVAGTALVAGPILGGVMWAGVRLFGRFAWRTHREQEEKAK